MCISTTNQEDVIMGDGNLDWMDIDKDALLHDGVYQPTPALPVEMWSYIFSWIPSVEDQLNVAIVCRNWSFICSLLTCSELNLRVRLNQDDIIIAFCRRFSGLRQLILTDCLYATGRIYRCLPPQLEQIVVRNCPAIGRTAFEMDLRHLPLFLQKISLSRFQHVGESMLRRLPSGLRDLNLANCPKMKCSFLQLLPSSLESLDLSGMMDNDTTPSSYDIFRHSNLKRLSLCGATLPPGFLVHLPTTLTALDLTDYNGAVGNSLHRLSHLQRLKMDRAGVPEELPENLLALSIRGCHLEVGEKFLGKSLHLEELYISGTVRDVRAWPKHLKHLYISHKTLSQYEVDCLPPTLTKLTLVYCEVDAVSLNPLLALEELRIHSNLLSQFPRLDENFVTFSRGWKHMYIDGPCHPLTLAQLTRRPDLTITHYP
ncbi:hypothetical protein PROFUN_05507 [Planoprotostelium fungivorum]|uniref:F-box domain-containing protein n=1 Tax=Planoprotostelium fungivorum TaxID=1890364 RepID=A0A2P6NQX6_9EUKA|nr:hypothetical protein PROFUN_05507 [Planoprotostelium fungivorum]